MSLKRLVRKVGGAVAKVAASPIGQIGLSVALPGAGGVGAKIFGRIAAKPILSRVVGTAVAAAQQRTVVSAAPTGVQQMSLLAGLPAVIAGGARVLPGIGRAIARRVPSIGGGTLGRIGRIAGGVAGGVAIGELAERVMGPDGCPTPRNPCAGYHWSKRLGRWVRNRRINPANGRAAMRAVRRVKATHKLLKSVEKAMARAAGPRRGGPRARGKCK